MRIVVAGGHGQIARRLHPLLTARGHEVLGLIRDPRQADAVSAAGATPVVCDLESDQSVVDVVPSADAIVFAAGAGPGSGEARKKTMDRDGALKLIDAARTWDARYLMISAMQAEVPRGDEVFQAYLRAKAEADAALRKSGLDYLILRPGRLVNEPPTGQIALAEELPRNEISRGDVAVVIAELIDLPAAKGRQFDVTQGDTTVKAAVASAIQAKAPVGQDTTQSPALHALAASEVDEVPVFTCIVYVAHDEQGVSARVANLEGIEHRATGEREALSKVIPRFKQRVAELHASNTEIPWIDPLPPLRSGEQQRFVPVHL
ncbi:MAG TPA: hypothetical protein DCY79_10625 [Planctomycetaceae bacterium]|nr:hypothetical protein [Planctomycetaceae bacterium]